MSETTNIEWCDSTFNPWMGCTKVSPACDHCYAERSTPARTMAVHWGPHAERHRTAPATWRQPERWNAQAAEFQAKHGRRQRVFCASLADVFDNQVPDVWRADLFELIRVTPQLDWLLLTKRPQNIVRMVQAHGAIAGNGSRYLPENVWLGTTCENQKHLDLNLPALLRTRDDLGARVLFLSIEPMLGPISLDCWPVYGEDEQQLLNWVICGGESGPNARPLQLQWVRSIVQQCRAAGVPVLVKQLGREVLDHGMSSPGEHWPAHMARRPIPRCTEADPGFVMDLRDRKGGDWSEWPEDLRVRQFPEAA
jgi:protein gp37